MLTPEERERCRYHLGYLNITEQVALSLGFPSASQLGFILESSMNNLLPEGEPGVRRALQELDCIEDQLSAMRPGLEAKKTGARNPSDTSRTQPVMLQRQGALRQALRELEAQYQFWSASLADTLGAPKNPFSEKHNLIGSGPPMVVEPS